MFSRCAQLLMLTLALAWGTGVGRALHEYFEHHHAQADTKPQVSAAAPSATAVVSVDRGASEDDHDNCITCHLLALTVATCVAAMLIVFLCVLMVTAAPPLVVVLRQHLPFPAISNRGPPTLPHFSL
jgi:hypothetical protein